MEKKIKGQLLKELLKELQESPEDALNLLTHLDKVVRPWQITHEYGNHYTTLTRSTILGREVANLKKDYPKWKVSIESQVLSSTPTMLHQKDAEASAKIYADDMLKQKGYILLDIEEKDKK